MEILQIVVLAVVQGLTEFLPVSSSAHLILVPKILGWPDQGLVFDVAMHIGTLLAVVWYFRKDLIVMTQAWFTSVFKSKHSKESMLAWHVIIATIPAVIAGLLFKDYIEVELRSALVIAMTTIIFGLLLAAGEWFAGTHRDEYSLSLKDVIFIGCFQAIALIPGTSRSGITITAALLLGLTKVAAARFSFLLSIPIILASGLFQVLDLVKAEIVIDWTLLSLSVVLSGVSAAICIHFFLKLINSIGLTVFVWYRMILGTFLLLVFMT
ncbi:MAG: undecaprenyl-diphosphate phosphatase [Gammaproteobacteria bacterium]|nr:undecaprenyl-diphosphate phosphatase [Gammaproteobacteria bacterium]